MEAPPQSITQLLRAWGDGDQQALDELIPLVYGELRHIARHQARRSAKPGGRTALLRRPDD